MAVDSILPHAKFGRKDHQEYMSHFIRLNLMTQKKEPVEIDFDAAFKILDMNNDKKEQLYHMLYINIWSFCSPTQTPTQKSKKCIFDV